MDGAQNLFGSSAGSVAVVALILALVSLAGVVLLLARQQRLLGQYQQLMMGTSGGNIEKALNDHVALVRDTADSMEAVEQRTRSLEVAGTFAFQNLGIVRFNPFSDMGGDQSFAIALADGRGDGLVLSSLHAREMTRIYGKPLTKWEAVHSLTDEEQEAVALAREKRS
jgi:hypothetical protein